ncbi:MAG: hypothetical protein ACYC64_14350 [Armatimonadota bacterium]
MRMRSQTKWLFVTLTVVFLAAIAFMAVSLSRMQVISKSSKRKCYAPFITYDNKTNRSLIHWIAANGTLPPAEIEGRVKQITCSNLDKCFFILEPEKKDQVYADTSIQTIEPVSNTTHRVVGLRQNVDHMQIAVTPNGSRVAILERRCTKQPFGKNVLEVISSEGSRLSTLELGETEYVRNFRWSPGGNQLVVAMYDLEIRGSQLLYKRRLVVLSSKLSQIERLTLIPTPDAPLAWSPDGQEIACATLTQSGIPTVFAEKPGEKTPRLLWQDKKPGYYVSQIEWLPDAVFILAISDSGQAARLFNVDPATGLQRYELQLPFTTSVRMSCNAIVAFMDNKEIKWFQLPTVSSQ